MLGVVIVEDEMHSREALKDLLKAYCPDVDVLALAASVEEGCKAIETHKPDLVFLDIELHTELGFDLLNRVRSLDFEVIFTTAFEHYALKAIKFSAIDYLLKPIDYEELQVAVAKVSEQKKQSLQNKKLQYFIENYKKVAGDPQTITLATSEGLEFIDISNIIRCEADGSYTRFYLKDTGSLLVSKHLKEYEQLLEGHHFYRIHHSNLVNLAQVKKYVRADGGYVVMKDGSTVSVSQKKREDFLRQMGQH